MIRSGKFIIAIIFACTTAVDISASIIKIGLFNGLRVESIVFSTVEGEYMLIGDDRQVAVIRKGTMLYIELSGTGLEVSGKNLTYGTYSSLMFNGISHTNIFQVRPVYPASQHKESEENLSLDIYNGFIRMINSLDLEKYIPGTVESEGGSVALPEYYKAQAVITRTFAIKNIYRHAHEGFNLCDGVHCQAYNGKSRMNKEIYDATRQTANQILGDKNGNAVVTAYHANCGGTTGNASSVWNRDLYYLAPVKDPFCDRSAHRTWSKTIPVATWNAYLIQKGYTGDAELLKSGEIGRQKYLDLQSKVLLLTDIREHFGLKSSYFHIEADGDAVVFRGHGYGHGLGLCQQGAMEMARMHYTYVDILMFYFSGLNLSEQLQ